MSEASNFKDSQSYFRLQREEVSDYRISLFVQHSALGNLKFLPVSREHTGFRKQQNDTISVSIYSSFTARVVHRKCAENDMLPSQKEIIYGLMEK